MQNIRALLNNIAGLAVTGIAFAIAATFGIALIALVTVATLVGLVVVKAVPVIRSATGRVRMPRRPRGVWNDGNGVVVDA